jgi:hypothetical protein
MVVVVRSRSAESLMWETRKALLSASESVPGRRSRKTGVLKLGLVLRGLPLPLRLMHLRPCFNVVTNSITLMVV